MAKIRIAILIAGIGLATWLARAPRPAPELADAAVEAAPAESPREAPAREPARPSAQVVAQAPAKEEPLPWDSLRERVRALDSTDQPGLDRLYQDAAERIRQDEPRALRAIEVSYPSLLEAPLAESFFVTSVWIRSSHAPASVLGVIWSRAPKGIEAPVEHGAPMNASERHSRIEAYALRELRRLAEAGRLSLEDGEKRALLTGLRGRAAESRSMDIGLEAFQLLAALGARAEIRSALLQRPAEERQLISQVLDPNT